MLISRESNIRGFLEHYIVAEQGESFAVTKRHHADVSELADALLFLAQQVSACLQFQERLPHIQERALVEQLEKLLKQLA